MRGRDGPILAVRRWFGREDKPLRCLRYNETYDFSDLPDDAQSDIVALEDEVERLRGAVTVAIIAILGILIWG